MNYYALSFVANDSKGIVADTTKVLFENGFNIADSSSTLLQGVFSMIFIVTHKEDFSDNDISLMFQNLKDSNLKVFKYNKKHEEKELIHYVISVYGADKAGIVHAIAEEIKLANLNIVDLQTKVTSETFPVYIMILEVTADDDGLEDLWQRKLIETAKNINTQINIKKIDVYEL